MAKGSKWKASDEREGTEPEGQRLLLNAPVPKPVFESSDRALSDLQPRHSRSIPLSGIREGLRSDGWRKESGGAHGDPAARTTTPSDPRPADGYPYRASFVADNDLALGKIVEKISHSSIWKDSAIFVIEDDAQDGGDHVDAHRSPVLVISPYARRGFVSHRHSSMPSVQKTIYEAAGAGAAQSGGRPGRRHERHVRGSSGSRTVHFTAFRFAGLRSRPRAIREAEDARRKRGGCGTWIIRA